MKGIANFLYFIISVILFFTSCSDRKTYAELLKDEKKIIADYIERNNIQVVTTFPKINEWGEKVYVKTSSGLYFHLVNPGDTSANAYTVAENDWVIVRYIQYTLTVPADTLYKWNTIDYPYPDEFKYLDYSESCQAFHEAVSYMKRNDSEAKIIVPSKIGFSEYMNSVTPLGYDLKIRIQKY